MNVMFLFLFLSLVCTLILLVGQKFYVRRVHGFILVLLYIGFLVCVVLTQLTQIFSGFP
jgi:hypothetical protein